MMVLPMRRVVPVTQRQTHWSINHCLCIQSVEPCTSTGQERWQETRDETGPAWRKWPFWMSNECIWENASSMQGTSTAESIYHHWIAAVTRRPFCVVSVSLYYTFTLLCSCFVHFEASLLPPRERNLPQAALRRGSALPWCFKRQKEGKGRKNYWQSDLN